MQPTISASTGVSLKTLLAELVQMPTLTNETATCQAAIDWIKYQVRDVPLRIHDITHKGHPALVLTTRDTKRPKLLLHCHLDIAPAPVAMMQLTERDGRYYGRGVFDMKYAAAAYIKTLQELGPDAPLYDLGVAFTTDEELNGGQDGCSNLIRLGWGADIVINSDAIGGWNIERAAKGIVRLRVESHGQAGHGSRPWQYRSAISQLMRYLDDVATHFPAEPCGDPEHGHNTLNIGTIEGGKMTNQVAAFAVAELDVRFMPGGSSGEILQLLHDIALKHPHITVSILANGWATSLDPAHPQAQRLARIIEDVAGAKAEFTLSHGNSESPYYAHQGMTVLMFGPPGAGHHSDDEWIGAEGLEQYGRIIHQMVEEVALVGEDTAK